MPIPLLCCFRIGNRGATLESLITDGSVVVGRGGVLHRLITESGVVESAVGVQACRRLITDGQVAGRSGGRSEKSLVVLIEESVGTEV